MEAFISMGLVEGNLEVLPSVILNLGFYGLEVCIVCSGCHNNTPQTGQCTQQKHIFSQSLGLEAQDQGVSRADFF